MCNKVVIELCVEQFSSEIILGISNQTRAAHSFDFEIMCMISDQIALHSVQLPFLISQIKIIVIVIVIIIIIIIIIITIIIIRDFY